MKEAKICPKCGTPQQWELWRHCICGYDFEPGRQPDPPPQEPEPISNPGIDLKRLRRFLWRLLFAAIITLAITKQFPRLHWLTSTATFVLLILFFVPTRLFFAKK